MHDIKLLEEKWEQYNKNRRRPYYIFTLVSVVLVAVLSYILTLDKKIISKPISIEPTDSVPVKLVYKPLLNDSIDSLSLEQKSLNISVKSDKTNTKELIPTLSVVDDIPLVDDEPINIKHEEKVVQKKKIQKKIFIEHPDKKMYLKITKSSSSDAYREVEKRFNQFQDKEDSLFLAKSYYEKREYKKAEYWALQTNKIDNNIEESWIVFVKAKIKLGHTKDAIHILTNYINQTNSKEARTLLFKLRK